MIGHDRDLRTLTLGPYPPARDGIGQHAAEFLAALPPGIDRHVLTISTGPAGATTGDRGVAVHRLSGRNPILAVRAWRAIRTVRPDVIQVHFAVSLLGTRYLATLAATCLARRRLGIPVVVTSHEVAREIHLLGPLGRLLHRVVTAGSDLVVVYTDEARDALVHDCRVEGSRVVVAPHGMTVQALRPGGGTTSARQEVLCTFGFFHPDKGLEILLGAARILREDPACPPFHVVVVGDARARRGVFRLFGRADRTYAARIDALIADGLTDVITRRPFLDDDDLDVLLQDCVAFVAPYLRTTQSGATSRAAGAGAAIVASDLPGLRASLGDAAGWVPPGDPEALAATLRHLLQEPARAEGLRAATRQRRTEQSMEATAAAQLVQWRRLLR